MNQKSIVTVVATLLAYLATCIFSSPSIARSCRWVMIDKTGRITKELKNIDIDRAISVDVLYPFSQNNKYGVINARGDIVIAPTFDKIYGFHERPSTLIGIDPLLLTKPDPPCRG